MQDAIGGGLYLDVLADTKGLRKDIKEKVAASTKGVQARIAVKLETARLATQAKKAAELAERAAAIRLKVEIDRAQAKEALQTGLIQGSRGVKVHVPVEFSPGQISRSLRTALASGSAGLSAGDVDVDVDANTSGAESDVESFRRRQESRPIRMRTEVDNGGLMRLGRDLTAVGSILQSLNMFPAIASGILVAAGAATSLASALYGVGSAAGSAVGVLGMLPGLAAAGVQGLLTVAMGFSGISKAVQSLNQADKQSAATAGQTAASHESAAKRIRGAREQIAAARERVVEAREQVAEARERVAEAQHQVTEAREQVSEAYQQAADARKELTDAQEEAARRVADAERNAARQIRGAQEDYIDAMGAVQRAQEELTQAREEAREELQQLEFSLRGASMAEEQAQIRLEEAQARYRQSQWSTLMTPREKRQAELDLRQAQLELEEAQDRTADLKVEHAKSSKAGVEGSERVTKAKENISKANKELKDSERDLKETREDAARDVADARRDAAKQIENAQKRVKDADEGVADARDRVRDAQKGVADAEKGVVKAQRGVRDAMRGVRDAQDALKDAMSAGEQQAAKTSSALANVNDAMSKLSPAGQRFARFIQGTLIPRFRKMRNSVQEALLPPLQRGIEHAMPLLDDLEDAFVDSGTVIGKFAEKTGKLAGSAPFRKDTRRIMLANTNVLDSFTGALYYLIDASRHLLVVTAPFVERFGEVVEKWAKGRAEAAKLGRETGTMEAWFKRAWKEAARFGRILGDLGSALGNVAKASRPGRDTMLDSLAEATEKLRLWTENPENAERMTRFFERVAPLAQGFGDLLNHLVATLLRLADAVGGSTLDPLFAVLHAFLSLLDRIATMPGGGTILSTILLLSGAGLALGLVLKYVGGIVKNIARLMRFTGLSSLFGMLFGRRRPSALGGLADDADDMGDAIDRELPKDKKKTKALGDVGTSAATAAVPLTKAGDAADKMGDKAAKSAKKTSLWARLLASLRRGASGLGGMFGRLGGALAGLGGRLGGLVGLGGAGASVVAAAGGGGILLSIKAFFGRLVAAVVKHAKSAAKLVRAAVNRVLAALGFGTGSKAVVAAAAGGGMLASIKGFFARLVAGVSKHAKVAAAGVAAAMAKVTGSMGKLTLPAMGGVLGKVAAWGKKLAAGASGALAKVVKNPKNLVAAGAKGGAKGAGGGPLGVGGGILAGVVGAVIGGGEGGTRGAVGGAISGGATGMGVGAMIGSVVPVVGTGIGAALGGVVGAVVGAITGGKWWGKIKEFFTTTLPGWFMEQIKKLPGALVAGLSALGGMGMALIRWAGGQLKDFGAWLGRSLLKIIEQIPVLLVELIFIVPRVMAKAAATMPLIFGWLVKQAIDIIPKVIVFLVTLPWKIVKAIAFVVRNLPNIFSWLGEQGSKAGAGLLKIIWKAIRAVGAALWKGMGKAGERAVQRLKEIRDNFALAGKRWLKLIRDALSGVVSSISKRLATARDWVSKRLGDIRKKFGELKASLTKRVNDAFNAVRDGIANKLEAARKAAAGILDKIKKAFSSARDGIGKIWDGLKSKLMGPVNWVGSTLYNGGIREVWRLIAEKVKLPNLPWFKGIKAAEGAVLPGYTPGRDVHRFVSPTGGSLDLSGGEAVMVPEWTAAMGTGRVHRWNRLARKSGPSAVAADMAAEFGTGGGWLGGFAEGGILGSITNGLSKFGNAARGMFADGIRKAANLVFNPILDAVAGAMSSTGGFGAMLGRIPKQMVGGVLDYLVKFVEPKLGGEGGSVVKAALSMVGRGDDRGSDNNNWITRAWGQVGEPWCAMFVSEAIKLGKATKAYAGYPTAAVNGYYSRMEKVGLGDGRPGDLGVYGGPYGHINVIEKKNPGGGYWTVGGNQNSLVQREVRYPKTAVLRPKFAAGGVMPKNKLAALAPELFGDHAPRSDDPHELRTPLVRMMRQLPRGIMSKVSAALMETRTMVDNAPRLHDRGGPVLPGLNRIMNKTGRLEWTLTPDALALLGGPAGVHQLNSSAKSLYRSRGASQVRRKAPAAAAPAGRQGDAIVNVYPQPRQSETEIGIVAARRLGRMVTAR